MQLIPNYEAMYMNISIHCSSSLYSENGDREVILCRYTNTSGLYYANYSEAAKDCTSMGYEISNATLFSLPDGLSFLESFIDCEAP